MMMGSIRSRGNEVEEVVMVLLVLLLLVLLLLLLLMMGFYVRDGSHLTRPPRRSAA